MSDPVDQNIEYLVEMGALVLYGMDGDEPIYTMVPEVMKVVNPALYDAFIEEMDEALLSLYEQGLVAVEYDENLKAIFTLTDEGKDLADKIISDGKWNV